ncbi:DNA-directed RNA polymerase I subunit RPA49-like isoform X1 [Lytechinus variegatus]|uniref:DNA-directed RNA polymerase I subunit RPA49-like isoform X1 n=1 Tax=Lytechinus variegatus TaxID=7654 RepID=UPI001BB0E880|nr:DNA-directed RNA polymerase I subunit RPA49-like isoform X1 [Lytechinus variegatus]
MATCAFISSDQEKPTLAKFSHGRLQRNSDGTWKKSPSFTLLRSSDKDDKRKNLRRILVAEADSMQYVGQNYGDQASKANSMCKYMVGVLDKKTGKMKIFNSQLLELHPWLGKKEIKEEQNNKINDFSLAEKKDRLTEAFGSSKKQRAMESRLKNKVGTEALETSAAKAVTHAADTPVLPQDSDIDTSLLPPCDRSAKRPQDVYKLEDIISARHKKSLQSQAEELLTGAKSQLDEWKSTKKYPQYVLDHVPALLHEADHERSITQATKLLFLTFLMKLHATKPKELKTCLKNAPPGIRTHLYDTFTQVTPTPDGQSEKQLLSKSCKDKLLSYILVLAQLIDTFHTDITALTKDLNVPVKRLLAHARFIGCKTSSQTITPSKPKKRRKKKKDPDDSDDDDDDADFLQENSAEKESIKVVYIELSTPIKSTSSFVERPGFGKKR